jgi:hypothetical protein
LHSLALGNSPVGVERIDENVLSIRGKLAQLVGKLADLLFEPCVIPHLETAFHAATAAMY